MNILNTKAILIELTALRLQTQFFLECSFAEVPNFHQIATQMYNNEPSGYVRRSEPRKPYTPEDIIYPDYEAQQTDLDRIEGGDDTELMLESRVREAFRREYGNHAILTLDNGSEIAVKMYSDFKQLYFVNQSKTGGNEPNGK